jgi:tRNA modification GTPase
LVFEKKDTIAAISTPLGYGGVGVIRISGPDAEKIARKIFRSFERKNPEGEKRSPGTASSHFVPRRMYYGKVFSPETEDIIDEALLVHMPAPFSYTTEDVVEIQAHAGVVTLKTILQAALHSGARLAEPGEFTYRAYTGGRIDLSQAEAVIDVIQAKTEVALKLASRQLEGALGKTAKQIKEKLLELYAMLEAEIEFPEEMEPVDDQSALYMKTAGEIELSIKKILENYQKGHLFREGMRMIIVGRVNVGKSSLMNRFLESERALVTEHPGTTRDSIEETLDIFGLPVVLIDTAGWRKTNDPVERLGIDRTQKLVESADFILFMVDAGQGVVSEDLDIYERIRNKEKMLVVNKTDLLRGKKEIHIPEKWGFFDVVYTSVIHGRGIDGLKAALHRFGTEGGDFDQNPVVPNIRQKRLFENAHQAIGAARRVFEEKHSTELAAMDIEAAMNALDQITGESVKTDVLDSVFSMFCIGK